MKALERYKLGIILIALAAVRFLHLGSEIDLPHSWRQYDTKQYIDSYYYDGADFLSPSVCWMGGHKTLLLEFPLPEYLIAQLYHVFGPDVIVARWFFLLFFLLSAFFLYKSLKLIFETSRVPEIATLIYGLMPLSIYYSRAVHIDFFVFAFSLGFLYFMLRALKEEKWKYLLLALGFGSVGFVVKAPYLFIMTFPVLAYALQQRRFKWLLVRSWVFVLPLILLFIWTRYTKSVNSEIPDWSFIPNFNRFTTMWYWYFGVWQQRLMAGNWLLIGERILYEVLGISGAILFALGVLIGKKNAQWWWALSSLGGSLVYLMLFFNLNVIHNYYQLPFTICCAVFIAMGIEYLAAKVPAGKGRIVLAFVLCITVCAEGVYYAENNYYTQDSDLEKIAMEIRKNTSRNDLLIISHGGLTPQCPLLLQPAGRYGWSIPLNDLTPALIYQLYKEAGATHLAVVYCGYFTGEFQLFFEAMDEKIGIPLDDKGTALYMCKLKL